jgi:hypothetical protein
MGNWLAARNYYFYFLIEFNQFGRIYSPAAYQLQLVL